MTKDASFKKVVRRHAGETGQRYTEALTDLEGLGARMHHEPAPERLLAHLRDRYGIDPVGCPGNHNTKRLFIMILSAVLACDQGVVIIPRCTPWPSSQPKCAFGTLERQSRNGRAGRWFASDRPGAHSRVVSRVLLAGCGFPD
jgi:hypothetical protein